MEKRNILHKQIAGWDDVEREYKRILYSVVLVKYWVTKPKSISILKWKTTSIFHPIERTILFSYPLFSEEDVFHRMGVHRDRAVARPNF